MGEPIRFIYLIKPIMFLIPHIKKQMQDIKKQEKFVWTAITLFIFLIFSQIPLYGIYKFLDNGKMEKVVNLFQ